MLVIRDIVDRVNIPDEMYPIDDEQLMKDITTSLNLYYASMKAASDLGTAPNDSRNFLARASTDERASKILGSWIPREIEFQKKMTLKRAS